MPVPETSSRLRVLCVCPHFAPTNAPDGHRVRLLLPHFASVGIDATVLAADPAGCHFPVEEWLVETLPASVELHRAKTLPSRLGSLPGMGSLSVRAIAGLRRAGDRLLSRSKFDLVYFSTTQFGVHLLGPRWKEMFGVPFAMDFQDPWVNDYYREHPDQEPPGGKLKFALADRFNRFAEPRVLSQCSGLTSVSPAYPGLLAGRYAGSATCKPGLIENTLVAPFPAEKAEFDRIVETGVRQSIFDPNDGNHHWVYTGRCGAFMRRSVRALFDAVAREALMCPEGAARLRIHFIGTSYSGSRHDSPVLSAAREFGLAGMVKETADRIPLSESLRCLLDATALIVPGSEDAGYQASKIHPFLLAERPLLAVFHERSPVIELLRHLGAGIAIPFSDGEPSETIAHRIQSEAFTNGLTVPLRTADPEALHRYSAEVQASQFRAFFDSILSSRSEESDERAA